MPFHAVLGTWRRAFIARRPASLWLYGGHPAVEVRPGPGPGPATQRRIMATKHSGGFTTGHIYPPTMEVLAWNCEQNRLYTARRVVCVMVRGGGVGDGSCGNSGVWWCCVWWWYVSGV